MPGFNKSRFVGHHELDDDLVCGICLAVFNNPVVTQCCQQTYCADCIEQWLKSNNTCPNDRKPLNFDGLLEPQRLIKIMINKLEISCDFVANGCADRIQLGQLAHHLQACKYNPEAKCAVCGEKYGQSSAKHNCLKILCSKNRNLEECISRLGEEAEQNSATIEKLNELNAKLSDENEKLVSRDKENANNLKKLNKTYEQVLHELYKCKANQTEITAENYKLKNDNRVMEEKIENYSEMITKISKHSDCIKYEMSLFDKWCKSKTDSECTGNHQLDETISEKESDNNLITTAVDTTSFQFKVENISKLSDFDSVFQHPAVCSNGFEWRIIAEHHIDEQKVEQYLGAYLGCDNGSSSDWSYYAKVELKIISSTDIAKDYCVTFDHRFCDNESLYGFSDFVRWHEVFDEQNGFVTNDSITIEAVISSIPLIIYK